MKHMCYNSLVSTHSPLESFRKNGRVRGAHPAHVHFPKAEGAGGLPAKVIFAQHATLKVADAECYSRREDGKCSSCREDPVL
jgi:hypothetical protein